MALRELWLALSVPFSEVRNCAPVSYTVLLYPPNDYSAFSILRMFSADTFMPRNPCSCLKISPFDNSRILPRSFIRPEVFLSSVI